MKALLSIFFPIVSIATFPNPCHATLTFRANGVISELNLNEAEVEFSIGQSWHLEVNYNESARDETFPPELNGGADGDENVGSYAGIDLRFVTEGYVLDVTDVGIGISNDRTAQLITGEMLVYDDIRFRTDFIRTPDIFAGERYTFTFRLLDLDAEVFDSDALPLFTPSLGLFESSSISLSRLGQNSEFISLETTSIAIVPEPSNFPSLVGLMSLFFLAWSRPRKKLKIEQSEQDNPITRP